MSRNSSAYQAPTVSELLDQIKRVISNQFDFVIVKGEISNLSRAGSGHYYLSLSDSRSLINGVIFRGDSMRIPDLKNIKDGDSVEVVAEINLYEKRGQVQLIIKKLRVLGEGDLKAQFEQLKRKLFAEGLFDEIKKKKLPKYPTSVAVISAEGSAALEDFINIHNRRSTRCDLLIIPAIMQGKDSSTSVIAGLKKVINLNKSSEKKVDCIVICRGGGSFEDLDAFNDESLARFVSSVDIPIISAIGHQTDYTILDYVADLRAETPSAAAEVLTESEFQLRNKLENLKYRLTSNVESIYFQIKNKLEESNPKYLELILQKRVNLYKKHLDTIKIFNRPEVVLGVYNYRLRLDEIFHSLKSGLLNLSKEKNHRVEKSGQLLNALNPKKVLERGYTIIRDQQDNVIPSVKSIKENQKIKITFKDGDVYAKT